MSEYADELALLWCVLLNAIVFAAAYRFAIRRMTRDRIAAVLDSALLGYAVQYASVCLPAALGALRPSTMTATALLLAALLWAGGILRRGKDETSSTIEPGKWWSPWIVLIAALFAAGDLIAFVRLQSVLPVMSNDALTYHFPAAVQWLQTGRLGLFPTWFFNPANTYSPLAGSTFIAWLIAPFDNDVLARFVEVPALVIVGLGLFQIARQLRVETAVAGLIAVAAVLARPMFFASIMGKDDLFVAAFFVLSLLAMTPARAAERFSTVRLGVALGLLLATKYTAIMSLPILVLVIDGPWKAGWRWRLWGAAAGVAVVTAGPWYWRNFWLTGNPVFPIDVSIFGMHLFGGLFTPARSEGLRTLTGAWNVLTGGDYGLPAGVMGIAVAGWLVTLVFRSLKAGATALTPVSEVPRRPGSSGYLRPGVGVFSRNLGTLLLRDPLLRICLLGPIVGLTLFVSRSPFPEVRFVFPTFLLLLACVAAGIDSLPIPLLMKQALAAIVLALSWGTALADFEENLGFAFTGVVLAVVGFLVLWFTRNWRPKLRLAIVGGGALACGIGFTFVYWAASVNSYRTGLFVHADDLKSGWELNYPQYSPMWQFIAEHVPTDATLAYTNLYLVYPLQGFTLDRRLVYAPTRPGVRTLSDLARLGDQLPGERLVPAAVAATTANADRATWMRNLRMSDALYLVIGKGGINPTAPEAALAAADTKHFRKLFENGGGVVYAIDWSGGE